MLNPYYIAGFVDGEGSFHVAIYKDSQMRNGVKIIPEFHVSQRNSSKRILEELKNYFNCGYIKSNHATKLNDQNLVYVVRNRFDLLYKIIPFFKNYGLLTEKAEAFKAFAKIVGWLSQNKHSTLSGVKDILRIAYLMNRNGQYRRKKIIL